MIYHALVLLATAVVCISADVAAYTRDAEYDSGVYGAYPVKTYISTDIVSPRPNYLQRHTACDDGQYTLMTPRGNHVPKPGAMILDSYGNLVWWVGGYNQVYNLMAQEYNGAKYLTFWAGDDTVGGHGAGYYYMLDSSYKEVHKFGAANSLDGDLHEFLLTEEGTALITIYQTIPFDLSSIGGKKDGSLWDCIIQEIDLKTGNLVFEWRASVHHALDETYREIPGDWAFDWYHINSIAKDKKGNYLTSARFTRSITYISGTTGEILWVLGGKRNNFKDLSDGKATNFAYQHDARWHDDFSTITLFDNGAADGHLVKEYSAGLRIAVDQDAMTATLLAEYINPQKIFGLSQGSLQVLNNGNVLVGYGNTGAMTEFSQDGSVLCDVHFGPQVNFGSGDIQSYRTFKAAWIGHPTTKPQVRILHPNETDYGELYVSWNGATEVADWVLQSGDKTDGSGWDIASSITKSGFETMFILDKVDQPYVRILGIDSVGNVLGTSEAWDIAQDRTLDISTPSPTYLSLRIKMYNTTALSKILMVWLCLTGLLFYFLRFWVGKLRCGRRIRLHVRQYAWAW